MMVRAKKHLGQHFLIDTTIAERISDQLTGHGYYKFLLEIGPGTGVLSQYLIRKNYKLTLIEIDRESVDFLEKKYGNKHFKLINGDFLHHNMENEFDKPFGVIGNFPYNISSQIFFRILDLPLVIPEIVCMLQKEVAERIASLPKSKKYGILSVLLQAYYNIEYLFTVPPEMFKPPPKVNSGVIRLKLRTEPLHIANKKLFFQVVKSAFQNRRKKLRNAVKNLNLPVDPQLGIFGDKRPEELSVEDFLTITSEIEKCQKI